MPRAKKCAGEQGMCCSPDRFGFSVAQFNLQKNFSINYIFRNIPSNSIEIDSRQEIYLSAVIPTWREKKRLSRCGKSAMLSRGENASGSPGVYHFQGIL